jgi:protein-arginine kinase activator protein McsA
MKKCYTCQTEKNEVDFNKNCSRADGLNSICKECSRERSKKYYLDNHDKHVREVGIRRDKVIQKNREFIVEYLKQSSCIDCGERDIVVLEFDHQRDKKHNISSMLRGHALETIKEEISKCVVRCANCHRRKTARDQNWFKGLL